MGTGWEDWVWDPTLFEGCAPHYVAGRLPYAPGLADTLAEALDLDGTGRLLDLGCGPGVVALRLAHLFEAVVGVDPDAGMLDEARRVAPSQTWLQAKAEDLPADLGRFRVATLAASFHWMDRPLVARRLRGEFLEPGGTAVQVDAPGYRPDDLAAASVDLPHPAPPDEAVERLVRRWLGDDRRAGQSIRNTSPDGEDAVFQAAGFAPADVLVVPDGRVLVRTVDDLVAQRLSSSPTAPHLFGDRLDEFVADLRSTLLEHSPTGRFSVRLPDNVLRIWR